MSDRENIERRFNSKFKHGDGCWLWTGSRSERGYGTLSIDGKTKKATHVQVWLTTGEWPAAGMVVCHRCDNPSCVRPDHLFVGTVAENNADRHRKGRSAPLPRPRTHRRGERHGCAKLNEQQATEILHSRAKNRDLVKKYGVSRFTITAIRSGRGWAHLSREESNG